MQSGPSLRLFFLVLFGLSSLLLLQPPNSAGKGGHGIRFPRGTRVKNDAGQTVAQLTSPCTLTSPDPPAPIPTLTYLPAGSSGASITVNGQNVGLDIYTSLNPLSSTKKVLLFVFGGGFFNLWRTGNQAEVAELQGVGQAFFQDAKASGVNMLTVVPRYEYYSPPPNLYSPPPDGATPAAYEAPLDIGCTIAWIRKYSHAYGGSENPDITLVGYSSGAGVVASVMLAANQFIPSPEGTLSDVTGVLTMSGNYDYKKAEDSGQVPYFEWYHIRGEPTSTPETSPLQQGSPSPASTLSVPWIIEYEQCDADEHYADAQRLSAALNGGWNNYPTYVYENTQHYTYSGYPYEPTPTPGPATHGDGQFALALYGSPLHNLLLSMINGVTPTPNPIPTWEAVPLPNIGGVPEGVQDVAVGDDGTMWVVTTATASPTLGQYYKVAKYSDPANGANNCLTNPVTDPGAAQRIAVDGYGDPWTVSGTPGPGTVSRLPGGLIAAAPTYSPGCVGCVGTASSFTPLPNATATDVGAGGGTLSGTAAPEVYRRFSRSIGSVWIASTTPSSDSPDDFLLEHWAGTGWSTSPAGIYGQQLAVDANGKPWVVIHDGTIWSTESLSGCSPTANFCEAPGIASVDVGAGGTVTWGIQSGSGAPPSPLPGLYSYSNSLVVPTWVRLAPTPPPPFVAAARITVTMDGFPVIADTTNDLWIYHPCTWPDGSPGGGNAAICSL